MADLPDFMKGWTPESSIPAGLKGYLDEYAEVREICIRAKWTFDGATTLLEAAQRLREYATDLEELAALGFELRGEIEDDYGFIGRPGDGGSAYPDDDEDDLEPAG